jgi:hypothetical protein
LFFPILTNEVSKMKKMLCLASVFLCLGFNSAAMMKYYDYLLHVSMSNFSALDSKAPHVASVLQDLRKGLERDARSLDYSVPLEKIGYKTKLGLATRFLVLQWLEDPIIQLNPVSKDGLVDTVTWLKDRILDCCKNDPDLVAVVLSSLLDGIWEVGQRLGKAECFSKEHLDKKIRAAHFVSFSKIFLSSIPEGIAADLRGIMFNLYKKTVTLYSLYPLLVYTPGAPLTIIPDRERSNKDRDHPGYFLKNECSNNKKMLEGFVEEYNTRSESFRDNYEVENGLMGVGRDIMLQLALSGLGDEGLSQLFGIDGKMFTWKNHYLFKLGRKYAIKSDNATVEWLVKHAEEHFDPEHKGGADGWVSRKNWVLSLSREDLIKSLAPCEAERKKLSRVVKKEGEANARLRLFIEKSLDSGPYYLKDLLEHIISDLILERRQRLKISINVKNDAAISIFGKLKYNKHHLIEVLHYFVVARPGGDQEDFNLGLDRPIKSFEVSWCYGMMECLDKLIPAWRWLYPELNESWLGQSLIPFPIINFLRRGA